MKVEDQGNTPVRFRLQTKFLIGIVLLEAILMAAIMLVVEQQMRTSILDEFLKRGLSVTRNLTAVNIDFVATYNYVKVEQNLERVVNENGLLYATVVYFDGEVAGYRGRDEFKAHVLDGGIHERTLDITDTLIQYSEIDTQAFCDIAVPIFLKNEYWGTVRAGFSLNDLHRALLNTRWTLLVLGLLGLGCGYLASVLLARRITGPIGHLVENIKAISQGKYDQLLEATVHHSESNTLTPWESDLNRVAQRLSEHHCIPQLPVKRQDELGMLARAFVHMSGQLKLTHEQLEDYARSLEDKVAKRTQALEKEVRERRATEQELQKANAKLNRLVNLDGLTQIANRRRFDEVLAREWQRLGREQDYLALLLCDVDYFKRFNDHYGHQSGDDCLREVARALSQAVKRPADLVARYGGEEFAVILPHTDTRGTVAIVEALQRGIEQLRIPHAESDVSHYVTLSIGVACMIPQGSRAPADLIASADQALYEAKSRGRNRYCIAGQVLDFVKTASCKSQAYPLISNG